MQLEHSPLTNDVVNVMGAVTEGGTLNVTNIGVAALVNGDSFRLFNAAGYSGSFAGYVLPPLITVTGPTPVAVPAVLLTIKMPPFTVVPPL